MTGKGIKKTLAAITSAVLIISACLPCFENTAFMEISASAQAYGQNDTVELPIIPIDPDEPDEPEDPENPDDPGNSTEPDDIPESVDLSKAEGLEITLEADSFEYSGKAVKPAVSVLLDGKSLTENTDYTISYSNNISIGFAKVTVTGIGEYCGSVSRSFKILPKTQTIKELDLYGSGFSCTLTRDYICTGYEIEYSLKPDFSLSKKKISNKVSAVKLTADLLEAGKTYYVRARSVKKVGSYSFYGKWSKTSKISSAPVYKISSGSSDFIKAYSTRSKRDLKLKTGWYSAECRSGKYYVKANYTEFIVDKKYVSLVAGSGKLYPTPCISQLGAKNRYSYGCGPTCVAMILNSEAGMNVTKNSVIKTALNNGWCNDRRGFSYNGCNQIHIKRMLAYFSKKPVSLDSIKGRTSKAILTLIKRQLNNGHRCIVTVRLTNKGDYTSNPVNIYNTWSSVSHYVVVAGWTKENGEEYFYIADPWYQDNTGYVNFNYGLNKVKAADFAKSVKSIPNSWAEFKNIVHFK